MALLTQLSVAGLPQSLTTVYASGVLASAGSAATAFVGDTVPGQFLRPDSNVTQTSFTNGFAAIDEVSASEADYAYGANNTAAVLEVGLTNPSTPRAGICTVRYRIAKTQTGTVNGGGAAVTITAAVYEGASLVAADSARTATGTWTTWTFTFATTAVSDWSNLRLRFTTSASGGTVANRRGGAISWAEIEAPPADVTNATYAGAGAATVAFAGATYSNAPFASAAVATTAATGGWVVSASYAETGYATVSFAPIPEISSDFAISGVTTVAFSQQFDITSLSAAGLPGAYWGFDEAKAETTFRIWAIAENLQFTSDISAFDEFEFDLLEVVTVGVTENAVFPSSAGFAYGVASASWAGESTFGSPFTSTALAVSAFTVETVTTIDATFAIEGIAVPEIYGTTAGSVYGVGAWSIVAFAVSGFDGGPVWNSTFVSDGLAATAGSGDGVLSGAFSIAGSTAPEFTYTTAGTTAISGVATVSFAMEADGVLSFAIAGVGNLIGVIRNATGSPLQGIRIIAWPESDMLIDVEQALDMTLDVRMVADETV